MTRIPTRREYKDGTVVIPAPTQVVNVITSLNRNVKVSLYSGGSIYSDTRLWMKS